MYPEMVLHLGGPLVSTKVSNWLKEAPIDRYFHISSNPSRFDPEFIVTDRIEMDAIAFCRDLLHEFQGNDSTFWQSLWKEYSLHIEELTQAFFKTEENISEPLIINGLSQNLQEDCQIFFANSLSIRYADEFFFPKSGIDKTHGNRGASGIDGNLSTAIGAAISSNKPLVAVIGDQALLHDIGALSLLRKLPCNITILILNNSGGSLFNHIPQFTNKEIWNQFFVAEHNLNFSEMAKAFSIEYASPKTITTFQDTLNEALTLDYPNIIEIQTTSETNLKVLENLKKQIHNKMRKSVGLYS